MYSNQLRVSGDSVINIQGHIFLKKIYVTVCTCHNYWTLAKYQIQWITKLLFDGKFLYDISDMISSIC